MKQFGLAKKVSEASRRLSERLTESKGIFLRDMKSPRLQHVRFNTDFLVKELKVEEERLDRVFFVSACKALFVRESRAKRKEGLRPEVGGTERRSHVIYSVTMANMESMACICT